MSTLLTPIITQLELDRDRLKELINGTETDTVDLEGRTEKSIAGQVNERIDDLAFDFTTAKNSVESIETDVSGYKTDVINLRDETQTFRNDAESFKTTAEGARDQASSYLNDVDLKTDEVRTKHTEVINKASEVTSNASQVSSDLSTVTTLKNQTDGFKTDAKNYRDAAQQAATDAVSTYDDVQAIASDSLVALKEPLGTSPVPLYPTAQAVCDPANDIKLIAGPPRPIGNERQVNRNFIVEEYDTGNNKWQEVISSSVIDGFDYTISANTLDSTKDHRWKCEDTFKAPSTSLVKSYTTRTAAANDIIFSVPPTGFSHNYITYNKPSVSNVVFDGLSATVTLGGIDASATASESTILIKNVRTNVCVHTYTKVQNIDGTINMDQFSIEYGILSPDAQYEVYCIYSGEAPNKAYTPWSDAYTFTTQQNYVDISEKKDKTDITYSVAYTPDIDYSNGTKLYKISMASNPTVTLVTPPTDEFTEVFVHIDGADADGTLTFPTSIRWNNGSFDQSTDLGATWTLVSLKWSGADWIGKVESSN